MLTGAQPSQPMACSHPDSWQPATCHPPTWHPPIWHFPIWHSPLWHRPIWHPSIWHPPVWRFPIWHSPIWHSYIWHQISRSQGRYNCPCGLSTYGIAQSIVSIKKVCIAVAIEAAWVVATTLVIKTILYLSLAASAGLPPALKYTAGTFNQVLGASLCALCWGTGQPSRSCMTHVRSSLMFANHIDVLDLILCISLLTCHQVQGAFLGHMSVAVMFSCCYL